MLYLTIVGNVEQFVDIIPKRVVLTGLEGKPINAKVKIIPKDKYPFTIKKAKATNTKNIAFTLEKTKSSEKIEYVLTVENLKKTNGRYVDTIKLTTDSKIRPEIKIYVIGNILDSPTNEKQ
jgi:tRNA 2-selenouridine synthase SelU